MSSEKRLLSLHGKQFGPALRGALRGQEHLRELGLVAGLLQLGSTERAVRATEAPSHSFLPVAPHVTNLALGAFPLTV